MLNAMNDSTRGHLRCRAPRPESGIALIQVVIIGLALFGLALAALVVTRSDQMISQNIVHGTRAFWAAAGGVEIGRRWVRENGVDSLPRDPLGTFAFDDASAQVSIVHYDTANPDGRRFRIRSVGTAPVNAVKIVEEVISVPRFDVDLGMIQIDGFGTPTDMEDPGGGPGVRIPDWTIDARNHDPVTGAVDTSKCSNVPPVAGPIGNDPTDMPNELDKLRCRVVQRANECCLADGATNVDLEVTNPGLCAVGTCTGDGCTDGACTHDTCLPGTCSGAGCVPATCRVVSGSCSHTQTCTDPTSCAEATCPVQTCTAGTCGANQDCIVGGCRTVEGSETCNATPCDGTEEGCVEAQCPVGTCVPGKCLGGESCTIGSCQVEACTSSGTCTSSDCAQGTCQLIGCNPGSCGNETNCVSGICATTAVCPAGLCESDRALWYVRGTGTSPRFHTDWITPNTVAPGVPTCDPVADPAACQECTGLELDDPLLRTTSASPFVPPSQPHDRGPLLLDTPLDPNDGIPVRPLSSSEVADLHVVIDEILTAAIAADTQDKVCINSNFRNVTAVNGEYGSLGDPKIVIVSDPRDQNPKMRQLSTEAPCGDRRVNNLVIEDGSVIRGAGLLILPREMWIKDATFEWKGLILVLENGKIKIEGPTCGAIYGGVLLQTNPTRNNARLDFDKNLENAATCPGYPNNAFSVNFSCDVLNDTIGKLANPLSWREVFLDEE